MFKLQLTTSTNLCRCWLIHWSTSNQPEISFIHILHLVEDKNETYLMCVKITSFAF